MMRMGLKVMSMNGMMIKKTKQFVKKCNACFKCDAPPSPHSSYRTGICVATGCTVLIRGGCCAM
jgi:rRNA maturation endonuclease Nob1